METFRVPLLKVKDFLGAEALNCEGWVKWLARHDVCREKARPFKNLRAQLFLRIE